MRLARSTPRLLAFPVLLVVAGIAIASAGWLAVVMPIALAPIASGGALVVVGIAWAAWLLSVRLDVEEAAIRVHWIGGERTYPLVAGPVTRVRFRGENASKLRARTGLFGWQLGEARLRDEEEVHVVRLAPTASAILVPTEKGRLAVAPANENELLDALTRAARARQRLEEAALPAPHVDTPPEAAERPAPEAEPEREPVPQPEHRPLTGIERAILEQRLAEERAAAAASQSAEPGPDGAPHVRGTDATEVETAPPPVVTRRRGVRLPRPRIRGRVPRPGVRAAIVVLPLAAAGMAWTAGLLTGRMPEPGTDLARLTSLALVLAGPGTAVGAIMALAWWPRIAVVVVAGGLAASVFVGRALLG